MTLQDKIVVAHGCGAQGVDCWELRELGAEVLTATGDVRGGSPSAPSWIRCMIAAVGWSETANAAPPRGRLEAVPEQTASGRRDPSRPIGYTMHAGVVWNGFRLIVTMEEH